MNVSEYPFSTFTGIGVSKDKIDIAELKGAAGKTIGNSKKEICRWITSLKETRQTIVVMEATGGYEPLLVKLLQGGRRTVRRTLFMATLVATRFNPTIRCGEETHHHSQHHGSHRPTLAGISDRLTKNGVLVITHQNADKASSTHRNNWLSLVWLRAHCSQLNPCHTPFHQPLPEYSIDSSNSTPHRTLKPMPQKILHPCRHTAQNLNSKIFFRICH